MATPKGQDCWYQEDMLTLPQCLKNYFIANDSSKFKTTKLHMEWQHVAFEDFSVDTSKLEWVEISNKNDKNSDIPKKPPIPQQLWYIHEKKMYFNVNPDATTEEVLERQMEYEEIM
ncbi:hypothetical protein P7K49_038181 [Saguinus oedipus]|uniref:Uncharacterized protein n=1 Tax=Saguinus oedipus TaxID=9490 RepID=A0ABQ9TEG1_SAGOE|nr:hypothetical protein P7K49_038181 [Saguinus oedipus]